MASLRFFYIHEYSLSIPLRKYVYVECKFFYNYIVIDHAIAVRALCRMTEHVFLLQVIQLYGLCVEWQNMCSYFK